MRPSMGQIQTGARVAVGLAIGMMILSTTASADAGDRTALPDSWKVRPAPPGPYTPVVDPREDLVVGLMAARAKREAALAATLDPATAPMESQSHGVTRGVTREAVIAAGAIVEAADAADTEVTAALAEVIETGGTTVEAARESAGESAGETIILADGTDTGDATSSDPEAESSENAAGEDPADSETAPVYAPLEETRKRPSAATSETTETPATDGEPVYAPSYTEEMRVKRRQRPQRQRQPQPQRQQRYHRPPYPAPPYYRPWHWRAPQTGNGN